MAVHTSSVYCPECCEVADCEIGYDYYEESHGVDECPTSAPPCSENDPPTCSNAQIDATLDSTLSWPMSCLNNGAKEAKAYVSASFDDRGSVSGVTTASCDRTGEGTCTSCGFFAKIQPIVVPIGNNRFKMRVNVQAKNAYWGGPYGYSVFVEWFIEQYL